MLTKRIIPTMLCRGRTLVKGKRFAGDRSVGHVQQAARVHAKRGVDELLILDIGATPEGRGPDLDMIRELSAECFIPITVGGGVKSLHDIDALLRAGADKVAIGAGWCGRSGFLSEAREHFGRQALVAIVEYDSALTAQIAVETAAMAGAGEILLQHRERDGTLEGYDLAGIRSCAVVDVPLIASGGCSGPEDMLLAIQAGADAVAAGALFQFEDITPRDCAKYLKAHGVEVRL